MKQVYATITNKKHHQQLAQESNHMCLKVRKSINQSVDRGLFEQSSENMQECVVLFKPPKANLSFFCVFKKSATLLPVILAETSLWGSSIELKKHRLRNAIKTSPPRCFC